MSAFRANSGKDLMGEEYFMFTDKAGAESVIVHEMQYDSLDDFEKETGYNYEVLLNTWFTVCFEQVYSVSEDDVFGKTEM